MGEAVTKRETTFDGMSVRYADTGGDGTPILFVHGWACDGSSWRFQVPAFAPTYRVIAPDLPGHGASDAPDVDYTEDLFARALAAVLADAGVERAVLVGHSLGTPAARHFDHLFPGRALAMVFVDGALRPTAPKEQTDQEFAYLDGPAYAALAPQIFAKLVGTTMNESVRAEMLAVMLATPRHVVVSAGRNLASPASYAPDPVTVPALAVMADASNWPADNESFYRSIAPGLEYQTWSDTGHFVMLERPADFNRALAAFLARVAPAGVVPAEPAP